MEVRRKKENKNEQFKIPSRRKFDRHMKKVITFKLEQDSIITQNGSTFAINWKELIYEVRYKLLTKD